MKKVFLLFFILALLLCSCGESKPTFVTSEPETQELNRTQDPPLSENETQDVSVPPASSTLLPPSSSAVSDVTKIPEKPHTHVWKLSDTVPASCSANGIKYYTCSCGEGKEEVLLSPPHDYVSQGCGNRMRCKHCEAIGDLIPHQFKRNVCSLCGLTVTSPVFVRNTQLNFDESYSSIVEKLGEPTEVLSEGELKSLVYASDLSALTVVQTDSVGLWGVFTLDPTAFFYIDSQVISADGFSGKPDTQSNTSYRELSSCRIYGFRDTLGTRKHYGLWLRYTECDYHYMTDPRIIQSYEAQARISYYYVNALRAMNGMAPLSWCPKAAKVSWDYSKKMASENFFDHDNLYGNRLYNEGILWKTSGENISQGYANAYFVCDAYYNCADHRNNILNSAFTHVGMGFAIQMDAGNTYPVSVLGTQTFYS